MSYGAECAGDGAIGGAAVPMDSVGRERVEAATNTSAWSATIPWSLAPRMP